MRKISILSLIAVLSAAPMMAKADPIPTIDLQGDPAGTITANTNVASTSYVQGAYNDLAGHVNTNIEAINLLNAGSSTEGSVDYKINSAITTVNGTAGDLGDLEGDAEGATSLVGAINAVDSALGGRLDTAEGAISTLNGGAAQSGSVANSIVTERSETATLTNKTIDFDDNTVTNIEVDNFKDTAIATTIADSATATDSKLVTEAAVRSAIDTINGNATDLDNRVGALNSLTGDAENASTIVAAINAVDDALNNKRLTVYTTWNSAVSSAIALSAATSAAQSGGSQEQSGGSQEEPEEP